MGSFKRYLKLREMDNFVGTTSTNHREILAKIIDLAWQRYEPEVKDFLMQLSAKDPDLRAEFQKIEKASEDRPPTKRLQDLGIVPSIADTSAGDDVE